MNLIDAIETQQLKKELPDARPGDTVRVHIKIVEGEKERIQVFEGVVIARKGKKISETVTVRKISYGVGVERIFPVNSPNIAKVEVTRKGKVRRAKLYYLRDKKGKQAKVAEREFSKAKRDKAMDDVVPVSAPDEEQETESVSSD